MFVYFIFYDDFDVHDIENDHQNVIQLKISKSEENLRRSLCISKTKTREPPNDVCTLCLEEIVRIKRKSQEAHDSNLGKDESHDHFIFRDYTKYNYNNSEYQHTCDCTPTMHSICFIDTYNKKKACII